MLTVEILNLYHRVVHASATYYVHLGTFGTRALAVRAAEKHLRDAVSSPEVFFGKRGEETRQDYICQTGSLEFLPRGDA